MKNKKVSLLILFLIILIVYVLSIVLSRSKVSVITNDQTVYMIKFGFPFTGIVQFDKALTFNYINLLLDFIITALLVILSALVCQVIPVKKSVLTSVIVCFSFISFLSCTYSFASAKIQDWYLVDSGKHMDIDGNSKYMTYINIGKDIWNDYKSGVIRNDSGKVIQDVYCSDTYAENSINATTYENGRIVFNTYNMSKKDLKEKINVATHELGHGLGLDHNTSNDIMYKYSTERTSLSQNDKESYDRSYSRYK
ncbi:MAG: matrixin family metalloprotease [Lachnospiraceae bacterium]|jgi:hypothetical protein|nr:matrixin family metalloprotease [Lachnospiraceae bacterium]MEE3461443.1 matrixin family metalloprotease [Lachnospiraceae bacterium]